MKIAFSAVLTALMFSSLWSQTALTGRREQKTDYVRPDKHSHELLERIPDYNSVINWTLGEVETEVRAPVGRILPDLGKTFSDNNARIRDELRQNLIKAMGYVRISDIFLLKEYYSMKSDVRYEIISHADRAFYYPTVQSDRHFLGRVKLSLFGKDGIARIFFRDIERQRTTKYLDPKTPDRDYFDGLIIDTITHPDFRPSILMRIFDQDGTLLYGPETVDKDALENLGVCEYTATLLHAFNSPRSGNSVFYTIPYEMRGRMKTEFILKNSEAARLFQNPKTIRSLNRSRVVVVKPVP